MRRRLFPRTTLLVSVLALFAVLLGHPQLAAKASGDFPKPGFNGKGELVRPDVSYREWVYIGTPLTPNDLNPPEAAFPEFHNVYIHPNDFDHWKRTGTFPDGTVIIKELVLVGATQAVSGKGYFMGEYTGLEAAIKDSKRFKDEPGSWAYFSFGHSYPLADTAQAFPAPACNACHAASAADDFVFTQFYPVLRSAKGKGSRSGKTMDSGSKEYQTMVSAMTGAENLAFEPTAETGKVDSIVPVSKDKLFSYLQAGSYKDLAAKESGSHPSRGPHTKFGWPVRVFLDPKIDDSLKAGNASHPIGSSIVKEMYDGSGKLQGWAVMVKTTADSAGGKGWFWYEVTSTTDGFNPVAAGNGVPLCFGCHFTGRDFVLSEYPLK
jgi:hypothetical protein